MDQSPSAADRIRAMTAPLAGANYLSVTLFGDADGKCWSDVYTHWVGFTDDHPRREIRAASSVDPDRMLRAWRELGEGGVVINDQPDLCLFLVMGGNGLVSRDLVASYCPEWLQPRSAVPHGPTGWLFTSSLSENAFRRAPAPKLRMRVLKRDARRCRICGRRADDHVDLELHVHHIRPWQLGGVTSEENLITLCHTCHRGLDPHFEPTLFEYLRAEWNMSAHAGDASAYRERTRRYQAHVRHHLRQASEKV